MFACDTRTSMSKSSSVIGEVGTLLVLRDRAVDASALATPVARADAPTTPVPTLSRKARLLSPDFFELLMNASTESDASIR